jgi:hypothetical protein
MFREVDENLSSGLCRENVAILVKWHKRTLFFRSQNKVVCLPELENETLVLCDLQLSYPWLDLDGTCGVCHTVQDEKNMGFQHRRRAWKCLIP